MDDNTSLSELVAIEIRVLLTRKKMSGRQLATALDVSQTWMSTRLSGSTPIDLNDLARIAAVLNVEVADLIPRNQEGRTVVTAGAGPSVNYRTKAQPTRLDHPNGHPKRTVTTPTSRRPVRVGPARA